MWYNGIWLAFHSSILEKDFIMLNFHGKWEIFGIWISNNDVSIY